MISDLKFYFNRGIVLILFMGILFTQRINAQQQNLDFFLTAGLNNSPLLKDYKNRIQSTLIDSMRIRAGQGILVNATSINSYAPIIHKWGYDEIKTDIAQASALVGISKEITGKVNLQNRYNSVRLQNQSTFLESNLSQKELKKEIIDQYIIAFSDQQNFKMNSEVLNFLRQEEQVVRRLSEQGIFKQTEYLSLMVSIRQQELNTAQSEFQLNEGLGSLNYICGIFDTTRVTLAEPGIMANQPSNLRNTIFYRQFVTDSLKLSNAARQIEFDYRPRLSVYADGGYLSSLALTPWKNFGSSVGLSLTVPVYDGRQRKMQLDQVKISEDTRSNYRSYFKNQYYQKLSVLERQLASLEKIKDQVNEQLKYVQVLIDANRLLLNAGDISITDYLLSVSNYLNARGMLIENNVSRLMVINEINYWSEK
jgi:outer membrane protein TolC